MDNTNQPHTTSGISGMEPALGGEHRERFGEGLVTQMFEEVVQMIEAVDLMEAYPQILSRRVVQQLLAQHPQRVEREALRLARSFEFELIEALEAVIRTERQFQTGGGYAELGLAATTHAARRRWMWAMLRQLLTRLASDPSVFTDANDVQPPAPQSEDRRFRLYHIPMMAIGWPVMMIMVLFQIIRREPVSAMEIGIFVVGLIATVACCGIPIYLMRP